jgi:hypothetical protein
MVDRDLLSKEHGAVKPVADNAASLRDDPATQAADPKIAASSLVSTVFAEALRDVDQLLALLLPLTLEPSSLASWNADVDHADQPMSLT